MEDITDKFKNVYWSKEKSNGEVFLKKWDSYKTSYKVGYYSFS